IRDDGEDAFRRELEAEPVPRLQVVRDEESQPTAAAARVRTDQCVGVHRSPELYTAIPLAAPVIPHRSRSPPSVPSISAGQRRSTGPTSIGLARGVPAEAGIHSPAQPPCESGANGCR